MVYSLVFKASLVVSLFPHMTLSPMVLKKRHVSILGQSIGSKNSHVQTGLHCTGCSHHITSKVVIDPKKSLDFNLDQKENHGFFYCQYVDSTRELQIEQVEANVEAHNSKFSIFNGNRWEEI